MSALINQTRKTAIGYTLYLFVVIPVLNQLGEYLFSILIKRTIFIKIVEKNSYFIKLKIFLSSKDLKNLLDFINSLFCLLTNIYIILQLFNIPIIFEKGILKKWQFFYEKFGLFFYNVFFYLVTNFLHFLPFSGARKMFITYLKNSLHNSLELILSLNLVKKVLDDNSFDLFELGYFILIFLLNVAIIFCNILICFLLSLGFFMFTNSLKFIKNIIFEEKNVLKRFKKIPKALKLTFIYILSQEITNYKKCETVLSTSIYVTSRFIFWATVFLALKKAKSAL